MPQISNQETAGQESLVADKNPSRQEDSRDYYLIGFGVMLLLFFVSGVLGYRNIQKLSAHNDLVEQTLDVLGHLESLMSTVTDAETGQRGYLLTQDRKYLKPYTEAVKEVQDEINHLDDLIGNNAPNRLLLQEIQSNVKRKLDEMDSTLKFANDGDWASALDIVRSDLGLNVMEELRESVDTLQTAKEVLLHQRVAELDSSRRSAVLSIVITTLAGLALTYAVFSLLRRISREQTRSAQVLFELKEYYRTTLASIGDAVISTDAEGTVTYLNAVAEELTGWSNSEAKGETLAKVFHIVNETTRQEVENPALRALKEGAIVGLANHTILIGKDGREHPIDDSAAPIKDEQEHIVGSVLIFHDITERKKSEQQMLEARKYAESIVNTVREPLVVLTEEFRVSSANRSYYDCFETTAEQTENHSFFEINQAQWDFPELHQLLEELLPEHSTVDDFQVERNFPGVGFRVLRMNARTITREEKQAGLILLAIEDITDQAESQKTERLLASVVEFSNDAIITKTLDGIIQTWNIAAEEIFGYTAEQAIGKHISLVIPQERIAEEDRIIAKLRSGGRIEHFETVRIRADGQPVHVSLTISPLRNAEGEIVGASKIARDITARKQIDDERIRLASIVEHSSDFIGISDPQGNSLFVNCAGRKMVGLPEDRDVGTTSISEFFVPAEREFVETEVIKILQEEGRWTGELTFQHFETEAPIPVWYDLFRVDDPQTGEPINFATVTRDLSERKKAEADLLESEQRYRTLFESMDEGFCIIEMIFDEAGNPVDYRFEETNQQFEKQSGLQNARGKTMRELVFDHDSYWFDIYGKVAKTGESIRITQESIRLGRWFDVFATPVPGPDKNKVAVLFKNITERIQAEQERERLLKEVEAERGRLLELFQRAPSFMCVLDGPDHIFERANDHYYQLVGERELIGKPVREALPEIEGQGFYELLDTVYQTGEPFIGTDMSVQVQRRPEDAPEQLSVDFVYQAIRNPEGEVTGVLAQGVDLTDRKRAEAALQENEQRFRMLVEQVEDYAIFMTDPVGLATSWNEGVKRVLGFEESEFIGQDIISAIFTAEDIRNGVPQEELKEAARNGSASSDRWMKRKDGTRFWSAGVTTGLHGDEGELLGYMKVMRDHTERKKMEDNLRQFAAELSEADRRKTEFLATLGHELRNPLAPIRTGLEAMKLLENDPNAVLEIQQTMERQVQQMVRLIDDLLDISRITQSKMELRTCRVALGDVVQSAVEATKPFIDESGHELSVSLPENPVYLNADPNRLAQVFSNLLNNSSKYTPKAGHIRLSANQNEDTITITIKDDGLGIPEDRLHDIFEMFTQIDRPMEKGYTGLGIGLTLVKRLVEMHHGQIEVFSEGAGQGSEFRVTLPVLIEDVQSEVVATEQVVQPSSLKILVVDDNKAAAKMLTMVVKMLGNEVRTAFDGQQAVEVAAEFRPQVILMDLGMPKMTGYEAAKHIRSQEWGQTVLLVALTGWGLEEDREKTRKAGFDHHLVKPAEPALLQQMLANYQPQTDQ